MTEDEFNNAVDETIEWLPVREQIGEVSHKYYADKKQTLAILGKAYIQLGVTLFCRSVSERANLTDTIADPLCPLAIQSVMAALGGCINEAIDKLPDHYANNNLPDNPAI